MTFEQEREKRIQKLQEKLADLNALDPQQFNQDRLNSSFKDGAARVLSNIEEPLRLCRELSKHVSAVSQSWTPQQLEDISSTVSQFASILDEILKWDGKIPDNCSHPTYKQWKEEQQQHLYGQLILLEGRPREDPDSNDKARRSYGLEPLAQKCIQLLPPLIAVWKARHIDDLLANIEMKSAELDRKLAAASAQLGSGAAATLHRHFHNTAKAHKDSAKCWLIGFAVLSILFCVYLLMLPWISSALFSPMPWEVPSSGSKLFQSFSVRAPWWILIPAVFFTSLAWCGRSHRGHRHNHVLNELRANVLRTFQAFAESSHTPEVRDAVLRAALDTAFMPGESGFLPHRDPDQSSTGSVSSALADIVRARHQ